MAATALVGEGNEVKVRATVADGISVDVTGIFVNDGIEDGIVVAVRIGTGVGSGRAA